jgi:hypothetical protein
VLDRIQQHLEAIYQIRCEHRASDFVVDAELGERLGGSALGREELLVSESHDGLELALVMPKELVGRLAPYDLSPGKALDTELPAFCEVAEGVSHFMYLSRAAALERQVSLLELEAQGEVDKFATCVLLRWGHGVGGFAKELMARLFDRAGLRSGLSPEESRRYQEAGRLGQRFCGRLLPLVNERKLEPLLDALRYAYRLGAEAKLTHLATAAARP